MGVKASKDNKVVVDEGELNVSNVVDVTTLYEIGKMIGE